VSGREVATGTIRVLVVDDEPTVRMLLRVVLGRDGRFEVVGEASDGQQGVDAVVETRPDIVLLDLLMPRMDGHEALPEIRRAAPDTMVLVLSSLSAVDEADRVLAGGAAAFLEKSAMGPGLPDLLLEHLRRFRSA
jgi:DNA-binding NarL/FixJ family response regulator